MAALNDSSNAASAIAQQLVDFCRVGRNRDAIDKLYADTIVSVEPIGNADTPAETTGIDAIRGKNHWWTENMVVHSAEVIGPFLGVDGFAVYFNYDTTFKPSGKRSTMKEMARYTVADGKIAKEEFFYAPSA